MHRGHPGSGRASEDLLLSPQMTDGGLREEITAELRQLFTGNVNVADGIIPPLVFVLANIGLGLTWAAALGLTSAFGIVGWRLLQGKALRFALAGLGGTLVAVVFALRNGDADDYFLPGIISGAATTVAIIISIAVRRPFVAWTSWLTRGWPIDWYWHPRVRPAYSRVSWLWAGFFGARTATQWWLYTAEETTSLGIVRVVTGWPALLLLLVGTYALGRLWLDSLKGPSVEEFETGEPGPWEGQRRGF